MKETKIKKENVEIKRRKLKIGVGGGFLWFKIEIKEKKGDYEEVIKVDLEDFGCDLSVEDLYDIIKKGIKNRK